MIQVIKTKKDFILARGQIFTQSIGVVPTMGNLHRGHLSLIKKSIEENDVTIITIFVNPKQFGPHEGFATYPRTLKDDILKISGLEKDKKVIIFAPQEIKEIYPEKFCTEIRVKENTDILCGKSRPGHFDGVTTVVYQIFSLTKPHTAYFGQKDYQQFQIIKRMVLDLSLSIELILCPIVRDESGLALSSRNQFLTESSDQKAALELYTALNDLKTHISNPHFCLQKIKEKSQLDQWEYLEILDPQNLNPIDPFRSTQAIILGAINVKTTRLIDNIIIDLNPQPKRISHA